MLSIVIPPHLLALILHDVYFAVKLLRHNFELIFLRHVSYAFPVLPIAPNNWNNYWPSTPYLLFFAVVPVVVVLALLCAPPTPLPARNLFFCCGSISLHPLHFLQSYFSAESKPPRSLTVYCLCSLLFFRTSFCLSAEWHATVWRHGLDLFVVCRSVSEFGGWLFGYHKMSTYEVLWSRWVFMNL